MTLESRLDERLYRRSVHPLGIASTTPRHYDSALRRFARFVATHSSPDILAQAPRVAWRQAMRAELPLERTIDDARQLDGFLRWLVDRGQWGRNPGADLRAQYGQPLAPLVRALRTPNPTDRLHALRPLPAFGSPLGPAMQHSLASKQTLGFRYARETTRWRRFDRSRHQYPGADQQPLPLLVDAYAAQGPTPASRFERRHSGRNLARGRQRSDPSIVVPTRDRFAVQEVVRRRRRPSIYTPDESRPLFAIALTMPSPHAPFRPLTLYTALAFAYGAGLRLGEVVRLTVGEVDLAAGPLDMRESQLFKSRRVPLPQRVLTALPRDLPTRHDAGGSPQPTSALLWNEKKRQGDKEVTLETLLTTVLRHAGLQPANGRLGPRRHDLRHPFVCHRLLAWYQAGVDVESRLPSLATSLGHKDINSTVVSLTVTQDLLQHANERVRAIGAPVVHPPDGARSCVPRNPLRHSCMPSSPIG